MARIRKRGKKMSNRWLQRVRKNLTSGGLKAVGRLVLAVMIMIGLMPARISIAAGKKTTVSFEKAMTETSLRMLQECVRKSGRQNVLISPDSILTALSMVENGASGKTLKEMEKALGGISVKKYTQALSKLNRRISGSERAVFRNVNSLWYRKGMITLKEAFLAKMTGTYGAGMYPSEFDQAGIDQMNQWVSQKTEGKIQRIINNLDPASRLVLINAVYFKGEWIDKYDYTVTRTFTKAGGSKQKVPMLEGSEHVYVRIAGADGFVKSYAGGKLAFLGLLPPKGMSTAKFVKKLTGAEWIRGYRNRQKSGVTVLTRMPEFKYEYSSSLKSAVKRIGIKRAFSGNAAFRNMTDDSVCIDEILHKTYIDVNRNGTEAAAATAVIMKESSLPIRQEVRKVYLDRPFVYAIIDVKTGVPVFIGTVNSVS